MHTSSNGDLLQNESLLQKTSLLKGIALWLIDNTAISFLQIAECCKLSSMDIQAIADDNMEIAKSENPVEMNLLSQNEIDLASDNSNYRLTLKGFVGLYGAPGEVVKRKRGRKSSTGAMLKRQSKPNAIAWLLEHCPGINDNKIIALVHTTPNTVKSIREHTHWNMSKIKPSYESVLEVCNKSDLEHVIIMSKVINDRNQMLFNNND